MIDETDAAVLKWKGHLGHVYCVVIDDEDRHGGRRGALESCDRGDAIASAQGEYAGRNPVVYQQIKMGKWKIAFRGPRTEHPTASVRQ